MEDTALDVAEGLGLVGWWLGLPPHERLRVEAEAVDLVLTKGLKVENVGAEHREALGSAMLNEREFAWGDGPGVRLHREGVAVWGADGGTYDMPERRVSPKLVFSMTDADAATWQCMLVCGARMPRLLWPGCALATKHLVFVLRNGRLVDWERLVERARPLDDYSPVPKWWYAAILQALLRAMRDCSAPAEWIGAMTGLAGLLSSRLVLGAEGVPLTCVEKRRLASSYAGVNWKYVRGVLKSRAQTLSAPLVSTVHKWAHHDWLRP